MADAGCQCVYVVDSAGALITRAGIATASRPLVAENSATTLEVGFHGHENLGLGVANSVIAAVRAGAKQIDGSCPPLRCRRRQHAARGLRRGLRQARRAPPVSTSSPSPTQSEDVVQARQCREECQLDRQDADDGLRRRVLVVPQARGQRQAERYGVSGAQILLERAGKRKLIGGQEDQLIDIALQLKAAEEVARRGVSCRPLTRRRRIRPSRASLYGEHDLRGDDDDHAEDEVAAHRPEEAARPPRRTLPSNSSCPLHSVASYCVIPATAFASFGVS